jgi:hypothetical protein
MSLPISFDDVPYFGNQYRGDLIITHQVIYYFPQVDVTEERKKRGYRATDHLGLIALPFDFLGMLIKELQTTTNQPKLREIGMWKEGETSQTLQSRLDSHIAELKKQPTNLAQFANTLPKPMRFALTDIKNLSLRGGLRFDTEYDSHDFAIGFHRKKLLRDALWEGGLINQAAI